VAKNRIEPFQFLYHQIANDIASYRATMPPARIESVRRVAELRFAEDFAPRAFKGYLKNAEAPKEDTESGIAAISGFFEQEDASPSAENPKFSVARLPAEDDPLLLRVRRVKARDNMLVDTIDLQYDGLYHRLRDPYREWRKSRTVEIEAIRKLEDERNAEVGKSVAVVIGAILIEALASAATGGMMRTPVTAGVAGAAAGIAVQSAVQAVRKASDDAKIHQAGLTELDESFPADAQPIVFEVEGETVKLTGTAEEKFKQWREILAKLYEREVGPELSEPVEPATPAASGPSPTK